MVARLPPLNALRAFEIVARHLSFTSAAKTLNVSQSAISHQIKHLEDYLSLTLIERKKSSVRLTEPGERLASALSLSFENMANALHAIAPQTVELRIILSPTIALRLLLPHLHQYEVSNPAQSVRITTSLNTDQFDPRVFDAGILYGSGNWGGCYSELLMSERLSPLCSPCLLVDKPCPQNLLNNAVLLHSTVDRRDWSIWAQAAGLHDFDTRVGITFDTLDLALRAATAGYGVVVGDIGLVADELRSGQLVQAFRQEVHSGRGYYFVCPEDRIQNPLVVNFREWVAPHLSLMAQVRPVPKIMASTPA